MGTVDDFLLRTSPPPPPAPLSPSLLLLSVVLLFGFGWKKKMGDLNDEGRGRRRGGGAYVSISR